MRILVATEHLLPLTGGIGTASDAVVRGLIARGHRVLVLAPRAGSEGELPYPVEWVRSVPVKGNAGFRLALPARAEGVLDGFGPDVVVAVNPLLLGSRVIGAAREAGVPVASSYHTDPRHFGAARVRADRSTASFTEVVRANHRASDANVVPSRFARETLREWGCGDAVVIGHGVDTGLFRPGSRWEGGGRAESPLRVGWVGRLSEEKRPRLLAGLARDSRLRLTVVGDGPLRGELERAMPAAVFTGNRGRADLADLYRSFDVVVHTCGVETFGLTVLEAQASGCAVVVPASGAAAELVEHGRTGLIAEAPSEGAYAAAVDSLIGDAGLLRRLQRGAAEATGQRTWTRSVRELDEVLGSLRREGVHR